MEINFYSPEYCISFLVLIFTNAFFYRLLYSLGSHKKRKNRIGNFGSIYYCLNLIFIFIEALIVSEMRTVLHIFLFKLHISSSVVTFSCLSITL